MFEKKRQHMYETVSKEMKDILVDVRLEWCVCVCVHVRGGGEGAGRAQPKEKE